MFTRSLLVIGIGLGSALGLPPPASPTVSAPVQPERPFAGDSLSLERVLALALKNHPGLDAQRSAVAAREAGLAQAASGINPELSVDVEDVAGTGAYRGFDAMQTTAQVSQVWEWGGKRDRRRETAALEKKSAEKDFDRKRMEIQASASGLFMEALHAQRRLALAVESKSLSERLLEAVTRRVHEGAASMADGIRARLAVTQAEMELRQDTLRLESAKRKLALVCGQAPNLPPLRDASDSLGPLPSLEDLLRRIDTGRPAEAIAIQVGLAESRLAQQRALAGPDITLSAGIRHSAAPGDVAVVGGFSLPLPLRNRNQGGKQEARHELERTQADSKAAILELKSRVGDIHGNMRLTRDEIETLRGAFIPDAARAAGVLEDGYKRGRFGMLEVLNAESDLFRHRLRHLECLLRYRQEQADLERLIGNGTTDTDAAPRDARRGKGE